MQHPNSIFLLNSLLHRLLSRDVGELGLRLLHMNPLATKLLSQKESS